MSHTYIYKVYLLFGGHSLIHKYSTDHIFCTLILSHVPHWVFLVSHAIVYVVVGTWRGGDSVDPDDCVQSTMLEIEFVYCGDQFIAYITCDCSCGLENRFS